MKIIVLNSENQHLLLEFTAEEIESPLFSSTLNRMRNLDELEVHKTGELVSVQVIDADSYETFGVAVDDIRELWMGDVVPGPKDLSNCPCFTFTPEPILEVDPEPGEVEVVEELVSEESVDPGESLE